MAKKSANKKRANISIKVDNLDKVIKEGKKMCDKDKKKWNCCNNCGGVGYFLGFLGAAIYYISTASGFWMGVLGFLKALVWPVFIVLELLKFLGA